MATYSSQQPTADTQPPSTPTNLAAVAPKFNTVNLSWSPSSDNVGVAGYSVYRVDRGASPIATVTTTTYADGTVKASTTYSYYVQAFDASGNRSLSSATATVKTPGRSRQTASVMATEVATSFGLTPNPFNPVTSATYSLAEPSTVDLEVADVAGRIVYRERAAFHPAGHYAETIDASAWASGVYYVRLTIAPIDRSHEASIRVAKGLLMK
jgi:hypothetical protein